MYRDWTFLTSHGLVLLALARRPDLRIREAAALVGITERAAQGIVNDLVEAGYLDRVREGRRNSYLVRGERPLRHPTTWDHRVADILHDLVAGPRVAPSSSTCQAILLACSDHRYQEPVRKLIAEEGLLGTSEVVLWPGGASALGGPDGGRILATLVDGVHRTGANRVLLVAHEGCKVPGAYVSRRSDPFQVRRTITRRRQRAVQRVVREVQLEPELWFLSERGARRVRLGGRVLPRRSQGSLLHTDAGATEGPGRPRKHLEGVGS